LRKIELTPITGFRCRTPSPALSLARPDRLPEEQSTDAPVEFPMFRRIILGDKAGATVADVEMRRLCRNGVTICLGLGMGFIGRGKTSTVCWFMAMIKTASCSA
jgi:hypothetical protein